jgi:hypothetical protein
MPASARDAALERLHPLVGKWKMEAGAPGGPSWPGEARVTFEWLEGRTFLIERWTVDLPEAPDGIAIIGLAETPESADDVPESTDSPATFRQHYFDSRGVHRVYEMSLDDGGWKLWRDGPPFAQRFTGKFADNGNTVAGRWEKSDDGSSWEVDFDLTYRKVG